MARCSRLASAHKKPSKLALERLFENPEKKAYTRSPCVVPRGSAIKRVPTEASDCCRFWRPPADLPLFSREEAYFYGLFRDSVFRYFQGTFWRQRCRLD